MAGSFAAAALSAVVLVSVLGVFAAAGTAISLHEVGGVMMNDTGLPGENMADDFGGGDLNLSDDPMPTPTATAMNMDPPSADQGNRNQDQVLNPVAISARGNRVVVLDDGNETEISEDGSGEHIKVRGVEANSSLNVTTEDMGRGPELRALLSNGRFAQIKIMPDTASQTALAQIRLHVCNATNNCTIVLKETGSGNNTNATYSVQAIKRAKLLGIFDVTEPVEVDVDAETGGVAAVKRPWWSFLAIEQNET